jgi:hypothetical protein
VPEKARKKQKMPKTVEKTRLDPPKCQRCQKIEEKANRRRNARQLPKTINFPKFGLEKHYLATLSQARP